ncbi:MAG: calcium-binding protein [Rhizobiaceae bacterium]
MFARNGIDGIIYFEETSEDSVNLITFSAQGATIESDQLYGIENVVGTPQGDRLIADERDNGLFGMNGGDVINGLGGNDLINGGPGGDILSGGARDDLFKFDIGFGADVITDLDQLGDDVIQINGFGGFFDFADLALTVINGDDVLVEGSGWSGRILLENAAGLVDENDFVFTLF